MSKVEIIVKVEDAVADKLSEIAVECENAGMTVEQQMSAVGMITGAIEQSNVSKVEQIKGVSYVEESKTINLAD